MTENFKILTPRAHVRERVGMYLGSVSKDTIERFVKGVWGSYIYVPALFKMVNEIIDNSIDEALRTNFKHANLIDVSIEQTSGAITVSDNGRGIPQNLIKDTVTGEDILQPVAAWTKTNAGTSFTEDRVTIGSNGVGSAATNFLSKSFVGTTWSNGSCVTVSCSNGAEVISVATSKKSGSGTVVSFQPDFAFFETSSVFDDDLVALVEDRLISLQLAFPEISFSFNKKKIPITDIKKYAQLFTKDGASVVIEKTDNVSYFFAASEDGFRTNSFLNGVNTYLGGTYVDYIMNTIIEELVVLIKRKHKIEVNKSTIKSGLSFVLFVRNFVNPKFDSQTKERLTSSAGSAKEHYEKSGAKDLKQIAKKIFAADDIIEPLIAAQIAKKNADELRDAKVAQKKLKKVKVAKHISATSAEASLALCEGDSAIGFWISVRDPSKHGIFPLRGVVMNTWDLKPSEVLKNKELSEVVAILGLNINDPDDLSGMTYKNIWTLTDADHDGNKIATLLVAFFYKFWPKLFEQGRIQMLRTPIMIASKGKETHWFYSYEEAQDFKERNKNGWEYRFIKGLGLLSETEYFEILRNPRLDRITIDDAKILQMMFGSESESRKTFMME